MTSVIYKGKNIVNGGGGGNFPYPLANMVFGIDAKNLYSGGTIITAVSGIGAATQSVGGSPAYSPTGLNGKPGFLFNGSEQFLDFGDILDNPGDSNIFTGSSAKFTFVACIRKTGGISNRTVFFSKYNAGGNAGIAIEINEQNKISIATSNSTESNSLTQETSNTFYETPIILTVTFDANLSPNTAKQKIRVNGVNQSLSVAYGLNGDGIGSNTLASIRVSGLQLSNLLPFNGAIGAIYLWKGILTDPEIISIENTMSQEFDGIF